MMKSLCAAVLLACALTSCEKTTVVKSPDQPAGKDTTVVVPATTEKKTETNTTIVNPPASPAATEAKH